MVDTHDTFLNAFLRASVILPAASGVIKCTLPLASSASCSAGARGGSRAWKWVGGCGMCVSSRRWQQALFYYHRHAGGSRRLPAVLVFFCLPTARRNAAVTALVWLLPSLPGWCCCVGVVVGW